MSFLPERMELDRVEVSTGTGMIEGSAVNATFSSCISDDSMFQRPTYAENSSIFSVYGMLEACQSNPALAPRRVQPSASLCNDGNLMSSEARIGRIWAPAKAGSPSQYPQAQELGAAQIAASLAGTSPPGETVALMASHRHGKKPAWTSAEDQVLLRYVEKHGPRRFNTLKERGLLERDGKSCRQRWSCWLRPDRPNQRKSRSRIDLTEQEEVRLLQLQACMGNKWSQMANHFPRHTPHELKNLWHGRMKKKYQEARPEQFAVAPSPGDSPAACTSSEPSTCSQDSPQDPASSDDLQQEGSEEMDECSLRTDGESLEQMMGRESTGELGPRETCGQPLRDRSFTASPHLGPGPFRLDHVPELLSLQSPARMCTKVLPAQPSWQTLSDLVRDASSQGSTMVSQPRSQAHASQEVALPLETTSMPARFVDASGASPTMALPLGPELAHQDLDTLQNLVRQQDEYTQLLVRDIKHKLGGPSSSTPPFPLSPLFPPMDQRPTQETLHGSATDKQRENLASGKPAQSWSSSLKRPAAHGFQAPPPQSAQGMPHLAGVSCASGSHGSSVQTLSHELSQGIASMEERMWCQLTKEFSEGSKRESSPTGCEEEVTDDDGRLSPRHSQALGAPHSNGDMATALPPDAEQRGQHLFSMQAFELQAALNILEGAPPGSAQSLSSFTSSTTSKPPSTSPPSHFPSSLESLPFEETCLQTLIDNTRRLQSHMLGLDLRPPSRQQQSPECKMERKEGGSPVPNLDPSMSSDLTRCHSAAAGSMRTPNSLGVPCSGSKELAHWEAKRMKPTKMDPAKPLLPQEPRWGRPAAAFVGLGPEATPPGAERLGSMQEPLSDTRRGQGSASSLPAALQEASHPHNDPTPSGPRDHRAERPHEGLLQAVAWGGPAPLSDMEASAHGDAGGSVNSWLESAMLEYLVDSNPLAWDHAEAFRKVLLEQTRELEFSMAGLPTQMD